MKTFEFDAPTFGYIELRESYEKNNCICLSFCKGYIRFDREGLEKDAIDVPEGFGDVIGVDFIEE
jgi:hypothetical protein